MSKAQTNTNVVVETKQPTTIQKFDDMPTNLNVSQMIRWLAGKGLKRGSIVTYINTHTSRAKPIRYQHVRNVLITPVKKA